MKTLHCFLVITLLSLTFPLYPQWVQQNLSGDIDVALGIDFINQDHGVVGGWHINFGGQFVGNAFFTTDAGTNWFEATIPDSLRVIVDLQMINENIAYGAGAYNQTFTQSNLNSNPSQPLNPFTQEYYEKIGMNLSGQEDYRGYFVETTDGGLTWHPKGSFEDSVYYLVGIHFFDQQTGFVLATGPANNTFAAILKTTDSGNSWNYVYGFETYFFLNEIKYFDQSIGFAVGTYDDMTNSYGVVLKTTNGGDNWTRTELPQLISLSSFTYLDINTILISGIKTNFSAAIFRSDDGGVTWFECCTYSDTHTISGINSLPASGVVIVYGRKLEIGFEVPFIEVTVDGGVTWYYEFLTQWLDYYFTKSDLVDESHWYITGTQNAQMGFVLFTDNAGGVPVELTFFSAEFIENQVSIRWTTASELNNMGFEVERKSDDEDWRMIGFIKGKGTTTEKQTYSFTDDLFGVNNTKLNYRLKQIDFDGSYEYSDAVEVNIDIANPEIFSLSQNYPNPFNPSTKIKFTIPYVIASGAKQSQFVTLKVYDILGNEIAILVNNELLSGEYEAEFDGTGLPSGIYFYQLKIEGHENSSGQSIIQTKEMVYLK